MFKDMLYALERILEDFGHYSHGSIKLAGDAVAKAKGEF